MGLVYSEPACQAAYDDDILRLSQLLREDASRLDAADPSSGDTPLMAACRRGNLRSVQYLLRQKADAHLTNKKQRSCLHCISRRKSSLMDFLLVVVLMPLLLLGYFLLWQQRRSSVTLMETILQQAVDVNATDYKGNSSLHYAAERKQTHLVPILLQHNANVSITNHDGETPLDVAESRRFHQIIVLLRKAR